MPHATLEHSFTLAAEPAAVLAILAEPASYVGLTPFVTTVRDVSDDGTVVRYTAIERFRFLRIFTIDNPIAVTLSTDSSRHPVLSVSGQVVSPGRVRMSYGYTISPDPVGSALVDTLHLSAPFGLLRYARSQARSAQLYRAEELARRLAG
jgi:hypothetical protein